MFLRKKCQGRVPRWKSGMQLGVEIGVLSPFIGDPQGHLIGDPIFSWMTPSFSSETQSFSSETPSSSLENTDLNFRPQAYDRRLTKCFIGDPQNFYQRPLGCHQRHQIFIITPQLFIGGAIIGDPNLFIGDSKIFIGDPNIFI